MVTLNILAKALTDINALMSQNRPPAVDETIAFALSSAQGALGFLHDRMGDESEANYLDYHYGAAVDATINFVAKADRQKAEWKRDLARLDELEAEFDQMEAHIARAYGAYEGEEPAQQFGTPRAEEERLPFAIDEPLVSPYDVVYQVFGALSKDEVITLLSFTSSPSDAAAMTLDGTYLPLGTKLVDTRYSVAEAVRLEFGKFLNWTKTEFFDYAMG